MSFILIIHVGDTVLHNAAKIGSLPIVKYLIRKNAPIEAKNNEGETYLLYILSHEKNMIEYAAYIKLWINKFLVNFTYKKFNVIYLDELVDYTQLSLGNTALHLAASNENIKIVELLVKKDVSIVDDKNYDGKKQCLMNILFMLVIWYYYLIQWSKGC